MKKYTILLIFVFITLCSCNKKEKSNSQIFNCSANINPTNINSFFVDKTYSGIYSLSLAKNSNNLRGNVKSIEEKVYETSIKFDEVYEKNIKINSFEYDSHNNIIKENYRELNLNFKDDIVSIKNEYSADGLKIFQQENYGKINNVPFNPKTKYFYDNNKKLIKQIDFPYEGDSTVVKFNYDKNGILFRTKSFDKDGNPNGIIDFIYDNTSNTLSADGGGFIVKWEYDNNCMLKLITRVSSWGGSESIGYTKGYEKIELNQHGDVIYYESYIIKNLKSDSLEYIDDINLIGNREDFVSESFEYKYDQKNNWIEKKKDNLVFRRKIIYN